MPSSNRVNTAQSTLSDLNVLFELYGQDVPEDSFPSFLETLLFDQAVGSSLPPPDSKTSAFL